MIPVAVGLRSLSSNDVESLLVIKAMGVAGSLAGERLSLPSGKDLTDESLEGRQLQRLADYYQRNLLDIKRSLTYFIIAHF